MGINSRRNCGNVCSVCHHKDCALYLYTVEEVRKMLEDAKRLATLSSERVYYRQIKMAEEHLKQHGENTK
jgi:hypothetical protein